MPLFRSFYMGGFECSTHRLRSGRRLDVIAATHHDTHVRADYARLQAQGIYTARSGLRWHLIEPRPYQYDFASIRPMLEAAHCVVLPSYYREGTPRSLIEACAIGRPIITTDMPGCRDVVIPGETGFLCAPRDAGALAAAMQAFLALDPAQRAAMGAAARRVAETRYDEAIVIAAYQDILRLP